MNIKTKSFELAVYAKGNIDAPKLALVLPGRLDSKDYPHMHSHVDFLAKKDYYALALDPPGTWESAGDIEMYTMTNVLKAIDELIEHFGNRPTLLFGHSRGGTFSMVATTKNPYVTHLITAMSGHGAAGWIDGLDVIETFRDIPPDGKKGKRKYSLPYSYHEDCLKYDPLDDLGICKKPKLYFYGTRDTIVNPDRVKEIYDKSAEPKMIHELESVHDYRYHKEIVEEINGVIEKFLDTHPASTT